MKTISILNLKGGVAKTFTAANMAYELYRRGYKVLLIDNDKQGNLSKAYSRYDAENVAPVTRLLAGDWESADELIQHTEYEGIDIVTANMSLFGATWNLTKEDSENQIERYKALVYARVQYYGDCTIYGKYDYCIIDNPPDIGLNVVNALAITDEVIVPVKVDEDALEGLDIVTEQIEDAKAFNPALKLAGVLITSYQNTDGEAAGVEWLEQKTDFNILGIIRYSKKVAENTFMAAYTTTLTEKMRAALRISSTSEKITEEINDCIAACKADLKNDGVKVINETDELIIRTITLYCKAEFGFNNNAEQFRKSYDALKMRLALSVEYNTVPEVSETDTDGTESEV